MFAKVLTGLSIVIALFLGYVASQPSTMNVSRQILIKAGPDKLFPYLNHSQKANEWMPWAASDPEIKMSFSGPQEGVGSIASWVSPGKMGTGQAEVIESLPNQLVKTRLTYTKPMAMSQVAEVTLTPGPEGTTVRWSVTGEQSFVGRLFCTFIDMDKMVGGEFEKGLNKLKLLAETGT